jgi:phosphatidylglycerol:prolipoprotein diacylglycerol transferase
VVHVLGYWDYYFTNTSQLWQLNIDGLSLWGGLLGGALVAAARLKRDPLRRRKILDAVAPYVAVGLAVGRVGEFLDGHGQGLPSGLAWATQYASRLAATPDFGVPRHPAQLYDALLALALFGLLRLMPTYAPAGTRSAAFLVLYGCGRLLLGAVRLDPAFLFGLQIEQLLAIGAVGFGVVYGIRPLLALRRGVARQPATAPQAQPRAREDSVAA